MSFYQVNFVGLKKLFWLATTNFGEQRVALYRSSTLLYFYYDFSATLG
jgi:hypothetical protein